MPALDEFITATNRKEFLEPDGWETLEQNQIYTDEELREFEEHLAREEQDLNLRTNDLTKQREELERQQEQLNAQKMELQRAVEHMEHLKTQKTEPPVTFCCGNTTWRQSAYVTRSPARPPHTFLAAKALLSVCNVFVCCMWCQLFPSSNTKGPLTVS